MNDGQDLLVHTDNGFVICSFKHFHFKDVYKSLQLSLFILIVVFGVIKKIVYLQQLTTGKGGEEF